MIMGGKIADIPKPHRRRFDDKRRKREARYSITKYEGIGVHYYAAIDEENNPIWDSSVSEFTGSGPAGWRDAHDDKDGKGRYFSKQCNTMKQAQRWIDATFKKEFGPKTHKLVHKGSNRKPKWHYKDGD